MVNNILKNEKLESREEELPVLVLIKQDFVKFNSVKHSNITNNPQKHKNKIRLRQKFIE